MSELGPTFGEQAMPASYPEEGPRRTPEMEEAIARGMAAAAEASEPSGDCSCNVVAVLEAEAGYFQRLAANEEDGSPPALFFRLQAEYLGRLAQRFKDGLSFADRMRAALRP